LDHLNFHLPFRGPVAELFAEPFAEHFFHDMSPKWLPIFAKPIFTPVLATTFFFFHAIFGDHYLCFGDHARFRFGRFKLQFSVFAAHGHSEVSCCYCC
jgi:hypothetical protein